MKGKLSRIGVVLFSMALLALGFLSCKAEISSDNNSNGSSQGSISVDFSKNNFSSREVYVQIIDKADITVSGTGMTSVSKNDVDVSPSESSVIIEKIPAGKNRVVSVQAKRTIKSILDKMDGVALKSIVDVKAGTVKHVSVSWTSTPLGSVVEKLISDGYDASLLDDEKIQKIKDMIPSTWGLTDIGKICDTVRNGTTHASYSMTPGSVDFKVNTAVSGASAWINDPVSGKTLGLTGTGQTISDVAPGTWDFYIVDEHGTVLYSEKLTVKEGESVSANSGNPITVKVPLPRLEDSSGKSINEFISSATTVYLSLRTFDGETPLSGGKIYYTLDGSDPRSSSTKMEYSSSGISVSVGTKLKAVGVCSGFYDSDVASWTFSAPELGKMHPSEGQFSPVDEATWASASYALGAKVDSGNTTFAIYSKNATKILLEIYDEPYGKDARYDYWLSKNSSDNIWRAKLSGDLKGKYYAFRCWGANWDFSSSWKRGNDASGFISDFDSNGNRFNPNKVVFDPYSRELSHDKSNPKALVSSHDGGMYGTGAEDYKGVPRRNFDTGKYAPKSVVVNDSTSFGTKPEIKQKDAIIYEAHVRGLTMHPSSARLSSILSGIDGFGSVPNVPDAYRGTYKGAAYMAKYLKALGINTIELLPVHESDNDANPSNTAGGNYWAYMTYGYFAPDRRYSFDKTPGGPTKEFKEMVKSFHDEGIEVYLDVVYNHTGEGGAWFGKGELEHAGDNYKTCEITFMRGIDNSTYYCLTSDSSVSAINASYWETTGCGNNMQCDNPAVRKLILDSLTYWIDEMGVDGFRYDLAPVLGRVKSGTDWNFSSGAQTLTDIASLGTSKNVEMIAEAWDTQYLGGYQVGKFPSKWGEWNGRFRDALRKYIGNGERGSVNDFINGDYDNFNDQGGPHKSVNFIVAHDGFTLADLCSGYSPAGPSYNGDKTKLQWPFGPSDGGDSSAPGQAFIGATKEADKRQANRNFTAIQMISRGVPLIVWGDEFNRTQNGNNNPYNVDSVATWNNYAMINTKSPHLVATEDASGGTMAYHNNFGTYATVQDLNGNFMFMKHMMNLRAAEPCLRQENYSDVTYSFKKENGTDDLQNTDRCVWIKIQGSGISGGHDYLVFMNMHTAEVQYTVPAPSSGNRWTRIADTASWAEANFNIWPDSDTSCEYTASGNYGVKPWSVVIFKQVKKGPTLPACEKPTITGTSPFTTTTKVTITPGTVGAAIYYTLDRNKPTKSSTPYTGEITISENTTVKAICCLSGYADSPVESKSFVKTSAALTENTSGVMLQGFTWNSAPRGAGYNAGNPSPNWFKWYNVVKNRASDIKDTFEYVWCPPPSKCDSSSSEGYAPTELNDLNNYYGTKDELTQMISAISPAKAIADIVVNHRAGKQSWGDFRNPSWCDDYYAICSDDEGFSTSGSPMLGSSKKGAPDTGEKYGAYRDLDHTNVSVQQGIIDWMNNVLKPAGFVGWRYDFVKGFGAKYVGKYNAQSSAAFSVGEYWPSGSYSALSPDAWGNEIKTWISNTQTEGGQRSRAFDFALKGAMNDVFGCTWNNNGTPVSGPASGKYGLLSSSANLYISQPEDAVTFVDNHDTGSNQGHWALARDKVGVAYALILTHPGFPCVSWSHYFTFAESGSNESTYPYSHLTASGSYMGGETVPGTSKTLRAHIDHLIALRKSVGIEYNSDRETKQATDSGYAAEITGTNGSLIVLIGSGYTPTESGYTLDYQGTGFEIWKKSGSGTPKCKTPKIEIAGGKATITCGTPGATIKYGFSESDITNAYSTPVTIASGQTIYAKASCSGFEDSSVAKKEYDTSVKVTLSCTKDAGYRNAVFFCGSFKEGKNWTKAVRGTWSTGNVWKATVTVPDSGAFEWKPLVGKYNSSEIIDKDNIENQSWLGGDNLKYPGSTSVTWY